VNGATAHLAGRAEALRLAFDRSFTEQASRDAAVIENLLTLSLASEPYALRLSEISGLFLDRRITPVPGGAVGLLGIAGFRGSIVPVYDLAVLLGLAASESPRWLVMAAAAPVALAFDAFDGHVQIQAQAIRPREGAEKSKSPVGEFVSAGDKVRGLVRLPTVLDAIRAQLPTTSGREGG
jgi:chemotaxis signal transduction protein